MKNKRFLAAALSAVLTFSSVAYDSGLANVYAVEAQNDTKEISVDKNDMLNTSEDSSEAGEAIEKEASKDNVTLTDTIGVQVTEDINTGGDKTEETAEEVLESQGVQTEVTEVDRDELDVDLTGNNSQNEVLDESLLEADDEVRVIIVMDGDSVIENNSKATYNSYTSVKVRSMEKKQKNVVSDIEEEVLDGEELDVRYHYTWLLNGIATEVPYGTIEEIEAVDGVKDVIIQPVYSALTDTTTQTAETYTVSDGEMIGREDAWADGYTGKGIKIAIIDTGIDDDHPNFAALSEDKLTEDSATKDTIAEYLPSLNASALYSGLTVDDVYYSTKIAYGFNYVDQNITINHSQDSQGDHGTHVAGIAAANDIGNGEAVGVAPDAQLYVMKVFGANGGAYTEDILAGLEDALMLGADVVNMSLGSPAGFTNEDEKINEIYERVSETNTVLAIAAGNSATMGSGNQWGTDTNLTSNPDNSIISSPAVYPSSTSVASINNVGSKSYYIETAGKKMAFIEASGGANASVLTLAGNSYEYAMVGNCGQLASDFEEADVAGKIAVVQRGTTAFTEKCQLAQDAGAVGCLVYNNVDGTISMDFSNGTSVIPCASITMTSGEYLKAQLESDPQAEIYFSSEMEVIMSDDGYTMSSFSSWGVSPNLLLEPDITAPGGNIYSTIDGGVYGVMSGTSMASPNVAGVSALVAQYVRENFPELTDSETHTFINALLMSTSVPVMYDESVTYSPRSQGSGLVSAHNAVTTNAYLSVDGYDEPKAQLFDDPEKTGEYTYSYNVTNFGDKTLYYTLNTTVQTEGVMYDEATGRTFMSTTPVVLDAETTETSSSMVYLYDYNGDGVVNLRDKSEILSAGIRMAIRKDYSELFRYDINGDGKVNIKDSLEFYNVLRGRSDSIDLTEKVLAVKAGATATITTTVKVTDAGKAYMDENFENGIYVEGFSYLESVNGDVELSLPYLGFYGDWTQAPIIDEGYYYEGDDADPSQYMNLLFTNFSGTASNWYLGLNPYFSDEINMEKASLSPNNDGFADYIDDIYVALLRNAKTFSITYTGTDGTVYSDQSLEHVRKSYYNSSYGITLPFVYSWYFDPYQLTDENGNVLANNTELILSISAELDYDKHESANLSDAWEIPITIDTEAPVIKSAEVVIDETTGNQYLEVTFSDNVGTAGVNFVSRSQTMILSQHAVESVDKGADSTMTFDVTGYGDEFYIILGDYAMNESAFKIKTTNNAPVVDESLLYGYRVNDTQYTTDDLFGWIGINEEDASTIICDNESFIDYALIAAEYVGGYIIAVDANKDLLAIKPGYWDERVNIASLGVNIRDMAFDPTTETLYAYDSTNYKLITIDVYTGEMADVTTTSLSTVISLACDDNGTLYGMNNSGRLCIIDKETGMWGDVLLDTYQTIKSRPYYSQSMTYDSEDGVIYWAAYFSSYAGTKGSLYKIDVNNGYELTELGTIAGNAEVVGLLKMNSKGFELPQNVEAEKIGLSQSSTSLLVGDTESFEVYTTPWYAEIADLVWTSDNSDVVTVDEDGKVTAAGVGTAIVTAATEDGKLSASVEVKVVNPTSELTGFVLSGSNLYNQWTSFNAGNTAEYTALTENSVLPFYAGEYVDGYIYAYSGSGELYKVNPETFEGLKLSEARQDYKMIDMAYNYADGHLYGIAQDSLYGYTYIARIDTLTGEFELLHNITDEYGSTLCGLAISTEGVMYVVSMVGALLTVDIQTGETTTVGLTGYTGSQYTQSMAYDHNTDELYWALIAGTGETQLAYVDTNSGKALLLGAIDSGSQIVSLFALPDEENIPERDYVAVESVTMKAEEVLVLEGAVKNIPVSVLPYNATDRTINWTVADESIAYIEDGMIHGVLEGTTTATGTIGEFEVTFEISIVDAAGALRGFIVSDFSSGANCFWGEFKDYDLSTGTGLAATSYYAFAGEYYNGKIYAYGVDAETFDSQYMIIDEETFTTEKAITGEYPDMLDLAFDYSEGVMYAVGGIRNTDSSTTLYAVGLETGESFAIAQLSQRIVTLAVSEDGKMYGVDTMGLLYEIDKTTGELTFVFETGYGANQYQSMAFDYDTGNLYWAQAYNDMLTWVTTGKFLRVDLERGMVQELGMIGTAGSNVTALYSISDKEMTVKVPEANSVAIDETSVLMAEGTTQQIEAKVLPMSVMFEDVQFTYSSDNEAVATVDANGVITAVKEGAAKVTVSYDGLSAICEVTVVGDGKSLYVMNSHGWQVSPLLQTTVISAETDLYSVTNAEMVTATYNSVDGYFYSVDTDSNLWKYTEDLGYAEVISPSSLAEQMTELNIYLGDIEVVDITANHVNGKIYALTRGLDENEFTVYINAHVVEIDPATGKITSVHFVPENIVRPIEVEFIDEKTVVYYDSYNDYVYSADINAAQNESADQIVWAQGTLVSEDEFGLVYSQELGKVFLATADIYNNGGNMALYILDCSNGSLEKYANAAYSSVIDLVLIEGHEPVTAK